MCNSRYAPYIKELQIDVFPPNELLTLIGKDLRREMIKRGLWYQSPGVLDHSGKSWEDHKTFYPLKLYFYGKSILTRFLNLQRLALAGNNIDSLVVRNIGYDLTDLQQWNDPVGRAVYENLNKAVRELVEKNILQIPRPNENWQTRINQNALLVFSNSSSEEIQDEETIYKALNQNAAWYVFAPQLGKIDQQIMAQLCDIICHLKNSDIFRFYFKSLIAAVKRDVRVFTIFSEFGQNDDEQNDDSIEAKVEDILDSIVESESNKEYIETSIADIFHNFEDFCNELRKAIENDKTQRRVRKRRLQLVTELQEAVEQQMTLPTPEELARLLGGSKEEKVRQLEVISSPKLPSQAELAIRLKAAVGSINGDMQRLRKLALPIMKDKVVKKKIWKSKTIKLIRIMLVWDIKDLEKALSEYH